MKIKVVILLGIYIVGLLAPIGTLINFKINQEEITEEFCENKNKPELACEGKCHLSKLLEEQSNEEAGETTNLEVDYPVGKINNFLTKDFLFIEVKNKILCAQQEVLTEFVFEIDHPPQV